MPPAARTSVARAPGAGDHLPGRRALSAHAAPPRAAGPTARTLVRQSTAGSPRRCSDGRHPPPRRPRCATSPRSHLRRLTTLPTLTDGPTSPAGAPDGSSATRQRRHRLPASTTSYSAVYGPSATSSSRRIRAAELRIVCQSSGRPMWPTMPPAPISTCMHSATRDNLNPGPGRSPRSGARFTALARGRDCAGFGAAFDRQSRSTSSPGAGLASITRRLTDTRSLGPSIDRFQRPGVGAMLISSSSPP
jgi:hypothetical protein